ncbi:MAG: GNAT family N-acetyltransferase [Rhodobiaceae bacterium]|nr:GNAT family N-acetyltransferase [Rhodobiaceae bacterium]MCC0056885.1 GNAT family N-acetyltransferase [Rhodobiaceae bacterium]
MSSPAQSYPAAVLAGGEYAARIIGPADARSLVPAWRELALKAMEPNVFYEPDFVLAAEPAFAAPGRLQFLTINRGESLVFLLPFRTVGAGAMMIAEAFRHPYATTTAPLVAASDARQALHLWLSGGAAQIRVSGWRLQEMPQDGALWQAMMEATAATGAGLSILSEHRRALLAPREPDRTYLADALSSKARKELARQRRRLAEEGEPANLVLDGADAAGGFEAFLELEAKGWKGRAGTAMLMHEDAVRFGRQAIGALAGRGQVRIDQILVAGKPVAITVMLLGGGASWLWKVAYDEDFAKFSPAVQLISGMTGELAANRPGVRLDSCAIPDHPMIDRLWRERLDIADVAIGLPGRNAGFAAALALTRAEKAARDFARRLLRR